MSERIESFRKLSEEELLDFNNTNGNSKRQMAFLDTIIHAMDVTKELDMEGVREEMEVFMFAGHDTTG